MTKKTQNTVNGYSLKDRKLRRWIYLHNCTLPYVARKMGIDKEELKRKLYAKEPFNKAQIRAFIYLVGAEEAIEIIYFPTIEEKEEVKKKVFGNKNKEENDEQSQKTE